MNEYLEKNFFKYLSIIKKINLTWKNSHFKMKMQS